MLALTDTEGKPHPFPASRRESVEAEPENDRQVVVDGERIKFLTEEMAKCEGEFSKRHNAPGCSSEMTPASQGPSREETLSAPPSSAGTRDAKRSQAKKWEPLTLSALLEYRAPLHVPGCGDFLFGKSKTWKLQWTSATAIILMSWHKGSVVSCKTWVAKEISMEKRERQHPYNLSASLADWHSPTRETCEKLSLPYSHSGRSAKLWDHASCFCWRFFLSFRRVN